MSNFKVVKNTGENPLGAEWKDAKVCKHSHVTHKGQEYQIRAKKEYTFSLLERFERALSGILDLAHKFFTSCSFSQSGWKLLTKSKKTIYLVCGLSSDSLKEGEFTLSLKTSQITPLQDSGTKRSSFRSYGAPSPKDFQRHGKILDNGDKARKEQEEIALKKQKADQGEKKTFDESFKRVEEALRHIKKALEEWKGFLPQEERLSRGFNSAINSVITSLDGISPNRTFTDCPGVVFKYITRLTSFIEDPIHLTKMDVNAYYQKAIAVLKQVRLIALECKNSDLMKELDDLIQTYEAKAASENKETFDKRLQLLEKKFDLVKVALEEWKTLFDSIENHSKSNGAASLLKDLTDGLKVAFDSAVFTAKTNGPIYEKESFKEDLDRTAFLTISNSLSLLEQLIGKSISAIEQAIAKEPSEETQKSYITDYSAGAVKVLQMAKELALECEDQELAQKFDQIKSSTQRYF